MLWSLSVRPTGVAQTLVLGNTCPLNGCPVLKQEMTSHLRGTDVDVVGPIRGHGWLGHAAGRWVAAQFASLAGAHAAVCVAEGWTSGLARFPYVGTDSLDPRR